MQHSMSNEWISYWNKIKDGSLVFSQLAKLAVKQVVGLRPEEHARQEHFDQIYEFAVDDLGLTINGVFFHFGSRNSSWGSPIAVQADKIVRGLPSEKDGLNDYGFNLIKFCRNIRRISCKDLSVYNDFMREVSCRTKDDLLKKFPQLEDFDFIGYQFKTK